MLRILFLNTWGGELWDQLREYIIAEGPRFDILCFSEVHRLPNTDVEFVTPKFPGGRKRDIFACQYDALRNLLPGHDGHYTAHGEFMLHDLESHELPIRYGNAMFVSHSLPAFFASDMAFGQYSRMSRGSPAPRTIQGATFKKGNDVYVVAHFHGLWTGGGKEDTEDRYRQSLKAGAFVTDLALKARSQFGIHPKVILGGDLNLTSGTKSLRLLCEADAFGRIGRVLNHEFGITDTRTCHYLKGVREADFAIVSHNTKVSRFEAPAAPEVSDHRPLILECE